MDVTKQLKGTPTTARTKTYSAQTGYVYQYVYKGYREAASEREATDFIFVARRANDSFTLTVRLLSAELMECSRRIGRDLLNPERYALAKMTLFSAFDDFAEIEQFAAPLTPDAASMEGYLQILGRI